MKQPDLECLRLAVAYATDPLEIVNAFYRFDPGEVEQHGWDAVKEHRLCCLAEMIVELSRETLELRKECQTSFMAGRGSRMAELAKQQIEIEQLQAKVKQLDNARAAAELAGDALQSQLWELAESERSWRNLLLELLRNLDDDGWLPEWHETDEWLIKVRRALGEDDE